MKPKTSNTSTARGISYPEIPKAKIITLTSREEKHIIALLEKGYPASDIAREYHVSTHQIILIESDNNWNKKLNNINYGKLEKLNHNATHTNTQGLRNKIKTRNQ